MTALSVSAKTTEENCKINRVNRLRAKAEGPNG